MKNVLQIVPKLPPTIDGVGDYALNLARQFRTAFGIETCFIVGSPAWTGNSEIEGFPVFRVETRSSKELVALLSSQSTAATLLHYSGYGYAKRGYPSWLVDGLQRWQTQQTYGKLVTMFHEVYASSNSPWTSSFWLSSLQKHLATQLVQLSDRVFTSNQTMARFLDELVPKMKFPISTLPIFSNVGELISPSPLNKRTRRLLIFGHPNSRSRVYNHCQAAIEEICQALAIEEICDVGKLTKLTPANLNGVPIIEKGILDAIVISQLLANSIVGYLDFPPPKFLAKSSIFAAYCAHGVIPCMAQFERNSIDGLQVNHHYWAMNAPDHFLNLDIGQSIADNAYAWYQTHSISAQAKIFASSLGII